MTEVVLLILVVITAVLSGLAVKSIMGIHNDNYEYCENETKKHCTKEDYEYCSSIER